MSDKVIYGILCFGGAAFFLWGLTTLPQELERSQGTPGGIINVLLGAAFCIFGIVVYIRMYQDEAKNIDKQRERDGQREQQSKTYSPASSASSEWEDKIASFVRSEAAGYSIRRNDRSIIPGRYGNGNLEIDIYIPELRFGIECNGTYWHDKSAYERDRRNGTEYSEEMYKEKYCAKQGIELIHVWDDMPMTAIESLIRNEIRDQRWG